jgi:hypothetical protein
VRPCYLHLILYPYPIYSVYYQQLYVQSNPIPTLTRPPPPPSNCRSSYLAAMYGALSVLMHPSLRTFIASAYSLSSIRTYLLNTSIGYDIVGLFKKNYSENNYPLDGITRLETLDRLDPSGLRPHDLESCEARPPRRHRCLQVTQASPYGDHPGDVLYNRIALTVGGRSSLKLSRCSSSTSKR